MAALRIIEGLLPAERPMSRTQKGQAHLDEKKAKKNKAVSATKAYRKGIDPTTNITSPKSRESVKNSSRMRRRKLVPSSGDVLKTIVGCQICYNFRAARRTPIKLCTNKGLRLYFIPKRLLLAGGPLPIGEKYILPPLLQHFPSAIGCGSAS
ncbi:hypothetical protein C8J57DRAFT_1237442 [Mycena rebaudengoi]|nr:hypothetical protein C8J57DRAFT_1237442 [Mycena rebaudengoi]